MKLAILSLLSTLLSACVMVYAIVQFYNALMAIPPELTWVKPIIGWGILILAILIQSCSSSKQ